MNLSGAYLDYKADESTSDQIWHGLSVTLFAVIAAAVVGGTCYATTSLFHSHHYHSKPTANGHAARSNAETRTAASGHVGTLDS